MTEVTAMPGMAIPGCAFRRDQVVTLGEMEALFLARVPAKSGEDFGKLHVLNGVGAGHTYVRLSRIGAMLMMAIVCLWTVAAHADDWPTLIRCTIEIYPPHSQEGFLTITGFGFSFDSGNATISKLPYDLKVSGKDCYGVLVKSHIGERRP